MSKFTHLSLHTEYSLKDSIIRIEDVIVLAKADGMESIAITDLNNMFGFIKFYNTAHKAGIKPIIGIEFILKSNYVDINTTRLRLLCKNNNGYKQLIKILSHAYTDSYKDGIALLELDHINPTNCSDLIASSCGNVGIINSLIRKNLYEKAKHFSSKIKKIFNTNLFLEVQRYGAHDEDHINAKLLKLSSDTDSPIIATHPMQFINEEDYQAHEARVCISDMTILDDETRISRFTKYQRFLKQEEMYQLFPDMQEALKNSYELSKILNVELELNKNKLPNYTSSDGTDLKTHIYNLSMEGLAKKIPAAGPEYKERIDKELNTINTSGLSGYFLIVQDFINWAKDNNIAVGPGRGSGAGSLVAYALGITAIDPIIYNLLFERFLNPERISMPDFDVDFCQEKRHLVINYVKQRYGISSVSQIATFGTMAARAAIRDIGRVLALPIMLVESIAKLIPNDPGKPVDIKTAKDNDDTLQKRYAEESDVKLCIDLACKIEGLARHVGVHAGGVLIAPGEISDYCPLYRADKSDDLISQYNKNDVETIGLVKFDLLGLKTLTIIEKTIKEANSHGITIDPKFGNLIDAKSYELLESSNTKAVFQLESRGMQDLLKKIKPNCIEDIIAIIALFRPGPLGSGMVEDFIKRKHGYKNISYFHEDFKGILSSTYGVIVYQEQVLLISQVMAGYSLGKADLLRRAIGKKDLKEMKRHRSIFIAGAVNKGYTEKLSSEVFTLIEKFAEYGFNKSHAAAYAMISYQTAYLKANHKTYFMAANMSCDINDTDKIYSIYMDCKKNNIMLLPPDINLSFADFKVVSEGKISYGLAAIKGVGREAAILIESSRPQDGYSSLEQLCTKLSHRVINKKTLQALVNSGCFDSINPNRKELFNYTENNFKHSSIINTGQSSLFDNIEQTTKSVNKSLYEKNTLLDEKKALGFCLSKHPFDIYKEELQVLNIKSMADLSPGRSEDTALGIISNIKSVFGKSGKFYVLTLDDGTDIVEVNINESEYRINRNVIAVNELLSVYGTIIKENDRIRCFPKKMLNIDVLRRMHAKYLEIDIIKLSNKNYSEFISILKKNSIDYGMPIHLRCKSEDAEFIVKPGIKWYIDATECLIAELNDLFGEDVCRLQYQ